MSELVKAQLAVMKSVPYLQKRGSKDLNYTFAGEADLIRAVRQAMNENGLTISPISCEPIYTGSQATKSGREMVHTRFRCRYRVSHVGGESIDLETVGEALDISDKAANKSMTIALKYAIRQFFLIETGDDPDVVAHNRDAENSTRVQAAVRRMNICRTSEQIDELVEKFRGVDKKGKPLFTEEQLSELGVYASRKRAELKGGD